MCRASSDSVIRSRKSKKTVVARSASPREPAALSTSTPSRNSCFTRFTIRAAYLTPDVVADISEAEVEEVDVDRVRLTGVRGHPRTGTLKVNVFFESGWLAEGEISYAGARAEARARLAATVLRERLADVAPLRTDLIGVCSIFGDDSGRSLRAAPAGAARDVRLRVAMQHTDRARAELLRREVMALYTCGPAGGGGIRTAIRPTLGTLSCLLPRERVDTRFEMLH